MLSASFAPLAHSIVRPGGHGGAENHYCRLSDGPCKHGETCPLKHLHHQNKRSKGHKGHGESDHAAVDGRTQITSRCHGSADGSMHGTLALDMRFLPSQPEAFHKSGTMDTLPSGPFIPYQDIFPKPLHTPPRALPST